MQGCGRRMARDWRGSIVIRMRKCTSGRVGPNAARDRRTYIFPLKNKPTDCKKERLLACGGLVGFIRSHERRYYG